MTSTFYVTTPIYYVNDLPHIGHIFTTVVADTVARYHRLLGDRTYFLTGTDEHGQNIERAAAEKGIQPIELANRVVERYHQLWEQLGISHDDFIRTTEARHQAGVREIIRRIEANGDFYVGKHEGWYCSSCETFYTEKELLAGNLCPDHERPTEWKSEENLFFRLSRYEKPLLELYDRQPEIVRPESRLNEVRSFVASGLRDLSVSRADLAWGIPFPEHPGQTVYVWLDALTNYISALGFGRDGEDALYQELWEGSGSGGHGDERAVRLHLVGKDILRHHAVYWPAFLLSAGLPLPTTIWAHGWWLRDQRKVSKSSGNLVRPDELLATFGPDVLRFFLLREMVFGQDASFSDEAFIDRYNTDLANDLGNTVSRVVTLSRKHFGGATPPVRGESALAAAAEQAVADYHRAMGDLAFHKALESLWRLLAQANQYLVAEEPWKRVKTEGASDRVGGVLWSGLEAVRVVATGLLPIVPNLAARVLAAIGADPDPASLEGMAWGATATAAPLPELEPLFPRVDKKEFFASGSAAGGTVEEAGNQDREQAQPSKPAEAEAPQVPQIDIEQFMDTQLRVATVQAAEAVPKSNKLLKLQVSLGEETRQLVAGIAKAYDPQDLVGRQVIIVANLKAAKLMGVESQGMVLAASVDGRPVLLRPDEGVPDGTRVR